MMPQPQKRPMQGQAQPLAQPQQENRSVDSSGNTGRQGPAWGAPAQPAAPVAQPAPPTSAVPQSNAIQASQQNGGLAAHQQQMNSVGGAFGQAPPQRNYYGEEGQQQSPLATGIGVGSQAQGISAGSGMSNAQSVSSNPNMQYRPQSQISQQFGQRQPQHGSPSQYRQPQQSSMIGISGGSGTSNAQSVSSNPNMQSNPYQQGQQGQAEQPGAPQIEAAPTDLGGSYMGPLQDAVKVPEAPQPIQSGQSSLAPGAQRQQQQQRRMQQRGYYGE